MSETAIFSGLLFGLAGSLHCAGMCGPIVLALGGKERTLSQSILSTLLYNSGRTVTYALMGIVIGLIGGSLVISGTQNYLSIATGAGILLFYLIGYLRKKKDVTGISTAQGGLVLKLNAMIGKRREGIFSFLSGLINGLLPCGFVYLALASALAFSSITDSVQFMVAFGVGTSPVLAGIFLAPSFSFFRNKSFFSKVLPRFGIIVAIVLILRGLQLGIPLVSPPPPASKAATPACCSGE